MVPVNRPEDDVRAGSPFECVVGRWRWCFKPLIAIPSTPLTFGSTAVALLFFSVAEGRALAGVERLVQLDRPARRRSPAAGNPSNSSRLPRGRKIAPVGSSCARIGCGRARGHRVDPDRIARRRAAAQRQQGRAAASRRWIGKTVSLHLRQAPPASDPMWRSPSSSARRRAGSGSSIPAPGPRSRCWSRT